MQFSILFIKLIKKISFLFDKFAWWTRYGYYVLILIGFINSALFSYIQRFSRLLPLFSYVSVRSYAHRGGGNGGGARDNWREQLGQMWSRSCRWLNRLIKRLIYSHARCNVTLCEIYNALPSPVSIWTDAQLANHGYHMTGYQTVITRILERIREETVWRSNVLSNFLNAYRFIVIR